MSGVGATPPHLACLQPQMGETGGKLASDRTQHDGYPPAASQGRQLAQLGVLDPPGDLGVEARDSFEQGGSHPGPVHRVGTPHNNESLRRDAGFPRCRRAQPAAGVQVHDGPGLGSPRQHRQPDPSQSEAGMPDEPGDSSRFGGEQVPPR